MFVQYLLHLDQSLSQLLIRFRVVLYLFLDFLVLALGGEKFHPAASVLRWMAIIPLIIGISNILGVQIMLPKKMNKEFNVILLLSALVSLVLIYPMSKIYAAKGAAITVLCAECIVSLSMAVFLRHKGAFKLSYWKK